METKSIRILKVTSILMIIGGALGTLLGIGAVIAATALTAMAGSGTIIVLVAALFILGGGVISLIAGILGVKNADRPEKASQLVKLGATTLLFSLVGNIMTLASSGKLDFISVIIGLAVPALYLYGALESQKKLV